MNYELEEYRRNCFTILAPDSKVQLIFIIHPPLKKSHNSFTGMP